MIKNNWRKEEEETIDVWLGNKTKFENKNEFPNKKDSENYVKEAGLQSLARIADEEQIENLREIIKEKEFRIINDFLSLKVMLYSQYYRLYEPSWIPKRQEVTDIKISACAPYVDVIICEKFQENIYKKIKRNIRGIENIKIYNINKIRNT